MEERTIYVVRDEQLIEIATFRKEFPEMAELFIKFLEANDRKHKYGMMRNDNRD